MLPDMYNNLFCNMRMYASVGELSTRKGPPTDDTHNSVLQLVPGSIRIGSASRSAQLVSTAGFWQTRFPFSFFVVVAFVIWQLSFGAKPSLLRVSLVGNNAPTPVSKRKLARLCKRVKNKNLPLLYRGRAWDTRGPAAASRAGKLCPQPNLLRARHMAYNCVKVKQK